MSELFVIQKAPQGSLCRTEMLEGRECLVFPVVMMVEGVHCGSGGPTFYSAEELGKAPGAWNLKPVVVRHPENSGVPISACSKEVLEGQSVGVLLNTVFEEGKLKSEAWIYKDKADKVHSGLLSSLRSGKTMEVSIGHYSEDLVSEGTWKGEAYEKVATNIRPDHLALLPSEKGACSVADGAGIPRVNCDFRSCADLSHEDLRERLYSAIQKEGIPSNSLWIEAVYDDYFVYYMPETSKYFRRDYSISDGEVSLGATSSEVIRQIEYITQQEKDSMKKEQIQALKDMGISDAAIQSLTEADAEHLLSLNKKNTTPAPEGTPTINEVQKYLESVPVGLREVLQEAVSLRTQKEQALVQEILACERNRFSEDHLKNCTLDELEGMAALVRVPKEQSIQAQSSIVPVLKPTNGAQNFSANGALETPSKEEPLQTFSFVEPVQK